jgi:uncharacterized oxidoreductase
MELESNTVLVTGGASGIGLALAERWLAAGSDVIICGRREDKLREARSTHPKLHIHACDLSKASDRTKLRDRMVSEFPGLNILVNNAGIQRRIRLTEPASEGDWEQMQQEIAINLEAPIHLCRLLIPELLKQPRPAIVNVGSGLAFTPLTMVPVYCATKAALHSFTLSLRHQLAATSIKVIEIIPPAVNTDLGGPGLHTFGVALNEFADAVFKRLGTDEVEIAYGTSEQTSRASRAELDTIFHRMNSR